MANLYEPLLRRARRTNTAIISYGQTGSGKTHTLFGPPQKPVPQDRKGLAANAADLYVLGAVF